MAGKPKFKYFKKLTDFRKHKFTIKKQEPQFSLRNSKVKYFTFFLNLLNLQSLIKMKENL